MNMKKVVKKKGSVLSSELVWIVLGLLVLVVLVWFTIPGFRTIIQNIFNIAPSNVDVIAQQCNLYCSTDQKNAFCCSKKTLVLEDKTKIPDKTCDELRPYLSSLNCVTDFCSGYTCP